MGTVEAIYISPTEGAPNERVDEVVAMAGVGLAGDHHASEGSRPGEQLTLVEAEAVEAAAREHGLELTAGEPRRNVVTRGVALNDLVDVEFSVGDVRVRGVELCHPCAHLEDLTGKPVLQALVNRGGLRAEILTTGTIRTGDPVTHPAAVAAR